MLNAERVNNILFLKYAIYVYFEGLRNTCPPTYDFRFGRTANTKSGEVNPHRDEIHYVDKDWKKKRQQ